MEQVEALQPAILLLFVGIVSIVLMRSLHMSPIVGYLLAGMIIGPYGFGLIHESGTTHLLAELGVVFLLFDIGLHFSLAHLWASRRDILGLGPLQMILCTAVLATIFALTSNLSTEYAILVGAALALSSTAVAVQTLSEYDQSRCPVGQSAISVLILQDICAIFLLILASSLGVHDASLGSALAGAVAKSVMAFMAAIVLGRFVISPLFSHLSKTKREEIFTAFALLIVLATAGATGAVGLSLTLGAFLGGMIISETPFRHLVQTEMKPFRGLLLGFFFITVGMSLDTTVLVDNWMTVLLVLSVLIGTKTLLVQLSAWLMGTPLKTAIQLGFLLSQGSEFAFVLIAVPAVAGGVGPDFSSILIMAIAGSMVLTPPLVALGHWAAERMANKDLMQVLDQDVNENKGPAQVIILGMTDEGRRVVDALEAHGISYRAFDFDHQRFVNARTDGYPVAFGDLADLRLAETIEIAQAGVLVITVARYEISKELTPIVQTRYPNLRRLVSVETDEERKKFGLLGMNAVVTRSFPKGIDLAEAVLSDQAVPGHKISQWIRRQQEQAFETMSPAEVVNVPA
ncbi:MAG: potassium transporter [Nitrospirales bacterium]|nr:MAG: potassium transporter [Nitrospirales bacterium]